MAAGRGYAHVLHALAVKPLTGGAFFVNHDVEGAVGAALGIHSPGGPFLFLFQFDS